jgi:hypothetical protein
MNHVPIGFFATAPAPPGPSLPLDAYTSGLWSCAGIARLLSSWTGSLLRVRRSSDNAEQDIGYLGDDTLDITALASFVGGNSAFVVRIYDQSGGGNDWASSSSGQQPRIVNAGTYDGKIVFDGSNDDLVAVSSIPANAAMSVGGRFNFRALSGFNSLYFTQGLGTTGHNGFALQYQTSPSNNFKAYHFTGAPGAYFQNDYAYATGERAELWVCDRSASNAARAKRYVDGAFVAESSYAVSGATPGNLTSDPLFFGNSADGTQASSIDLKWLTLWSSSQDANGSAITSVI